MLAFIDDSGDPGFNFKEGSTKHFVISVVVFDDELEAERTATAIKVLKRELFQRDDVEFKFAKTTREHRERFLRSVADYSFRVRSLVIDKSLIYSSKLKDEKNSFYSYAIKLVLKNSGGTIVDSKVRIDGSGDRLFRRTFLEYLRRELNTVDRSIVKNCKLVDSKDNVLIQMADMIAGSVRRSYDLTKSDRLVYRALIKDRIEDEWQLR